MRQESAASRAKYLCDNAHLPEVQAIIADEIARGTIRVVPATDGGIRIIWADGTLPDAEPETPATAVPVPEPEPEVDQRRKPVLRIRRLSK